MRNVSLSRCRTNRSGYMYEEMPVCWGWWFCNGRREREGATNVQCIISQVFCAYLVFVEVEVAPE